MEKHSCRCRASKIDRLVLCSFVSNVVLVLRQVSAREMHREQGSNKVSVYFTSPHWFYIVVFSRRQILKHTSKRDLPSYHLFHRLVRVWLACNFWQPVLHSKIQGAAQNFMAAISNILSTERIDACTYPLSSIVRHIYFALSCTVSAIESYG